MSPTIPQSSHEQVALTLQQQVTDDTIPSAATFETWVAMVLNEHQIQHTELSLRIVSEAEIQQLNAQYRGKNKPTNVLAFPYELESYLGDLVICADVVKQQAQVQGKPVASHWAHMVIHGCLHLLGYDHIEESEAKKMEALEKKFLRDLGINDPY